MKTTIFFLFFLVLAPVALAAAGIVLPPVEEREYFFSPGAEYEWTWSIHRSDEMTTWLSGDLAEYAELKDPNQGGGPRSVTFSLKLPDELEPGLHILTLNAREEIEETSGVQARAAVGGQIKVISLYPEPWVQARLKTYDAPENRSTKVDIDLLSYSEVDTTVYAQVHVFDLNGNELISTESNTITVGSQQRKTITVPLDTTQFAPGAYKVTAVVKGAQDDIPLEGAFRIGILDVYLDKHTKVLPTRSINKFEVEVISRWTGNIENVYAEVTFEGMTERTPSATLKPMDGAKLYTFFDMRHITNDTIAEGNVQVFFDNGRSRNFPITINITNELAPRNERPGFVFELNSLTGLYLLLLILVIINVALLLRRKKQ